VRQALARLPGLAAVAAVLSAPEVSRP
jgi:hypothetical protein